MAKQNILLVVAPYYKHITDALEQGANHVLKAAGYETQTIYVPGAFEIPPAIKLAQDSASFTYAGYVALGCVIRGETSHYDYVCEESARGLMDLSLHQKLAIGYGILTVENEAQALARAALHEDGTPARNKGAESAYACLSLIETKQRFA